MLRKQKCSRVSHAWQYPQTFASPSNLLFQIKICGVTSPTDAQEIALAGADAIGLNFFAQSPRSVNETEAQAIVDALPNNVKRVGVFVNHPEDEVLRLAESLQLDWIQLHGDEPPQSLEVFAEFKIIRAFRCRNRDTEMVRTYLSQCTRLPNAVLIDAYAAGSYGGTGKVVDWTAARSLVDQIQPIPLVLAGGLHPDNVGESIRAVHPQAVDTASGVEEAPGVKAKTKVERFVAAAAAAFGNLSRLSDQSEEI